MEDLSPLSVQPTGGVMLNITNREFVGTIVEGQDPKNEGRYKVHIPELMHNIPENKGIWVKNHVHKYRYTKDKNEKFFGEYKPLHPGTIVIVKFLSNDYNSGYIDRILSDYEYNMMPLNVSSSDRDQITVLILTKKYNHILALNEDTQSQPPDSIHIYYNKGQTKIVVDNQGVHIYTDGNIDMQGKNIRLYAEEQLRLQAKKEVEIRSYESHICGKAHTSLTWSSNEPKDFESPVIPTYEPSTSQSSDLRISTLIMP